MEKETKLIIEIKKVSEENSSCRFEAEGSSIDLMNYATQVIERLFNMIGDLKGIDDNIRHAMNYTLLSRAIEASGENVDDFASSYKRAKVFREIFGSFKVEEEEEPKKKAKSTKTPKKEATTSKKDEDIEECVSGLKCFKSALEKLKDLLEDDED